MSIDGAIELRLFPVALQIRSRSNKLPPFAEVVRGGTIGLRQTISPRAAAAALRIASMLAL